MMRLFILIVTALMTISCTDRDQQILDGLHSHYTERTIEYINDIGCLGIGTVNPKDFSFDLVIDTLNNFGVQIDIEDQEYIIPVIHKPGYHIFHMAVNRDLGEYYEVCLNDEMSGYVKKEEVNFYSWPELLDLTICIDSEYVYTDREMPAPILKMDDHVNFVIEKIDGEWLLVREIIEYEELGDTTYWVKWRDGDSLLISPLFIM